MSDIQYAISLWNYIHYSNSPELEHLLTVLKELQYGVELWHGWPTNYDLHDGATRAKIKDILSGMPVSFHSEFALTGFEAHRKQIDIAKELTASVIVLHADNLYFQDSKKIDYKLTSRLVEYASQNGIQLALENGQLPILSEAVDEVPGLKICLDIGHVYLVEETMEDFLTTLKDSIVHLHFQEILSDPELILIGKENIILDHYTPGTGGIPKEDWALLKNTLTKLDYKGMAVFEIQPRNPLQTAFLGKTYFEEII